MYKIEISLYDHFSTAEYLRHITLLDDNKVAIFGKNIIYFYNVDLRETLFLLEITDIINIDNIIEIEPHKYLITSYHNSIIYDHNTKEKYFFTNDQNKRVKEIYPAFKNGIIIGKDEQNIIVYDSNANIKHLIKFKNEETTYNPLYLTEDGSIYYVLRNINKSIMYKSTNYEIPKVFYSVKDYIHYYEEIKEGILIADAYKYYIIDKHDAHVISIINTKNGVRDYNLLSTSLFYEKYYGMFVIYELPYFNVITTIDKKTNMLYNLSEIAYLDSKHIVTCDGNIVSIINIYTGKIVVNYEFNALDKILKYDKKQCLYGELKAKNNKIYYSIFEQFYVFSIKDLYKQSQKQKILNMANINFNF